MTREEIISGLRMTMELIQFDPVTGNVRPIYTLNDLDKTTYLACKEAIKILKAQDVPDTSVEDNGDTIYRQDAIDALYKMLHDYFWADDEELDAAIATLNDLPSAQQEPLKITIDPPTADEMERLKQAIRNTPVMLLPSAQPEIIKCKDCKYWQDQQEGVVEVSICARPENKYDKLPFRFIIGKDGFCSFAERRTDEIN